MSLNNGVGMPPPAGPRPMVVPVLIVPPERPLEVVVVGCSWLGLACHWWRPPGETRERTTLCTAPCRCICLSEPSVPYKWHCYLSVIRWSNYLPAVLSLTHDALEQLHNLDPDGTTFRGMSLLLRRTSAHKSSRVKVERNPKDWPRELMPRFNIEATMQSIYGREAWARWRESHQEEDLTL